MHKKMLRVARRIANAPRRRSGSKAAEELAQARDYCSAPNAMMPTGMEFSAGFMRRICAPKFCAI